MLRSWKNNKKCTDSFFYADDGLLENNNPEELQNDLNIIIKLFEKLGLKTNKDKTKCMIIIGTPAPKAQTTKVQERGLNYKE